MDDNLVETDRIGAGAFFWSLPSKGFQMRKNLIDNVSKHTEEVKLQNDECHSKIALEKDLRESMDGERERMLKELSDLQKENSDINVKLKMYEKCDPKRMDELSFNRKVCKDGMTRWTDNLFEMESWMRKNNAAMGTEEMQQAFPILRDLDYLE